MRKILISIIGVILLIIVIVSATKGIKAGKLKVYSIKDVKQTSQNLDAKIAEAETEKQQNYGKAVSDINKSITELKNKKEEYEAKINSLGTGTELGITQIEKYKIEYLWNKIGSYAKNEGLKIDLDIQETTINDTYNINFSIIGSYVDITDFLYDIENDDDLNYKVSKFSVEPTSTTSTSTSGKTTTNVDNSNLKATFTVENIIINFN